MIIEFYKKQVYGKDTLYIKDLSQSQLISRITGKKTIDEKDISNFSQLGIEFVQVMN